MPLKPPVHNPHPHMTRKHRDDAYNRARADAEVTRWRNGKRWKMVRRLTLERDRGLCQECKRAGVTRAAQQVHHLTPAHLCSYGQFHYLPGLESICTACHGRESARERRS